MSKLFRLFALVAFLIGLSLAALYANAASNNLITNANFSAGPFMSEKPPTNWTFKSTTDISSFLTSEIQMIDDGTSGVKSYTSMFCYNNCPANNYLALSQKINSLITGHLYQLNYMIAGSKTEQAYDETSEYYYQYSVPSGPFHVVFDGQSTVPFTIPIPYWNGSNAIRWQAMQNTFTYKGVSGSAILSFFLDLTGFASGCVPCITTEFLANTSLSDITPAGPILSVQKALNGNRGTNTDQFTVQILNGINVVNSTTKSTTTGTGLTVDNGTGTTGPTTLVAGTSYVITEAGSGATNLGGYSSTLACTNSTGTKVPTALNTAFTLSNTDTVSCTIANKALPATLALRQLVQKPVPINIVAPYTFSYTGNNGWPTQPVTNDSQATLASSPTQTLSAFNTATTLSAIMPARWSVSTFSCVDINAAVSGNPPGELVKVLKLNTITIPAANVRPGANLRCTSMLSRLTP